LFCAVAQILLTGKHPSDEREGDETMSITRIFRVRIDNAFKDEFDYLFSTVALHKIHEAAGYISASIHKPTKWAPDEYAMISQWESEASLKAFFGEEWNQALITRVTEKFVVACWVHLYESWETT
jgi:quinol monooxygenase YgiN